MGVTSYDAEVIDALRHIAADESERVISAAARFAEALEQPRISIDTMKLSCESSLLLHPPIVPRLVDSARIHNARQIAWPLGTKMRVPLVGAAPAILSFQPSADSFVDVNASSDVASSNTGVVNTAGEPAAQLTAEGKVSFKLSS
jgi:hypothetical protein